jgi:hypothetical protein
MRYPTKDEKIIPRLGDKGGKIYSITVVYDDDTGIIFDGKLLDEYDKRMGKNVISGINDFVEQCRSDG